MYPSLARFPRYLLKKFIKLAGKSKVSNRNPDVTVKTVVEENECIYKRPHILPGRKNIAEAIENSIVWRLSPRGANAG